MGVAVDLLDGIVTKLNETSFGTATSQRALLPEIERKGLTPQINVWLEGKESFELDRSSESLKYMVAVGLSYPTTSIADLDSGLDMIESIHDWLARRDNREIVTASGSFRLLPPVEMSSPFDSAMAQEAALFFSVLNINYHFTKTRV
tara:strand:- start:4533 stop:4973 length:441 start_codon:yes stop_codon:yes gene_type:complete